MKSKKMLLTYSLILSIVLLIISNVLIFTIGMVRLNEITFWLIFGFSNFFIIFEELYALLEFRKENYLLYTLFNLRLHWWNIICISIQFLFMLIITITNRFVDVNYLIVLIIEVLFLLVFIIRFFYTLFTNNFALNLNAKLNAKNDVYKTFIARIKVISVDITSEEVKQYADNLIENMSHKVLVSNEKTKAYDDKIDEIIKSVELDTPSDEELLNVLKKINSLIEKREIIVKNN